ncbi:MAG: hypothetical protein COT45_03725 [bacterium (Candidatus Stahlbacteria) CG08_land_8_20_14_0_20_40_26]|nr:MAG: hypothetical protein COX49_07375 [bacterium (Candidatus Stahlbacteria) CG23_combo_of_CG06-09_8_20_14_all_40_9]PIS24759.1 MAG: hypothetical protein COT45_03725 [bacterium (Candidatus Stahlbacteria) CG08_land_8_20_14_0_20_40_26]
MREIINFPIQDIKTDADAILKNQGISPCTEPPEKINALLNIATDLFYELSAPVGILSEVSISEFEVIYCGEGQNEKTTPVDEIFRQAANLALFAVTLGEEVSQKINELFKLNEFALGSMLDSVASEGTEKAGDITENHFFKYLIKNKKATTSTRVVRYSPGYCGWHISGQKKLFEFLHPEDIGISLGDSFLMHPLKSISGVVIAGQKEIHYFKDNFPFCHECTRRTCRERIKSL